MCRMAAHELSNSELSPLCLFPKALCESKTVTEILGQDERADGRADAKYDEDLKKRRS
jgi:hypothetical protein